MTDPYRERVATWCAATRDQLGDAIENARDQTDDAITEAFDEHPQLYAPVYAVIAFTVTLAMLAILLAALRYWAPETPGRPLQAAIVFVSLVAARSGWETALDQIEQQDSDGADGPTIDEPKTVPEAPETDDKEVYYDG